MAPSAGSVIANPTPTAATAATPAPRRCPNPEGGSENKCLGDLAAGTYSTQVLNPKLTYTVPAGWANYEDLPGNFLLIPPGGTLGGVNPGTSDYIGVYPVVVAPEHCGGIPSQTVPGTFDGLVGFLESHPAMVVTREHKVTVGGLSGVVLDVAMKPGNGDGCSDGVYADTIVGITRSSLIHSVTPGQGTRLYLLRNGSETLAIEVADAYGGGSDYPDWYAAADKVIATFVFTPG